MAHRLLEVSGERLPGWVAGFVDRHGPAEVSPGPDGVRWTAADGAVARMDVPFGPAEPAPGADPVTWLADRTRIARDSAVLLLRRGGYAIGVTRDGTLTAHRSGTRYVQSRTAAGGWSQQRFARRRDGQAAALVKAVAQTVTEIIGPHVGQCRGLILGGDRALVDEVLTDPRLAAPPLRTLSRLPRTPVLDVKDPRRATLDEAVRRAAAVRIHLDEP